MATEGNPGGAPAATSEPVTLPLDPAASSPAGTAPAQVSPDLSWAGADFLDNGSLKADDFRSHVETLRAEKAARDEALAKVPEAYEFTLPADIDLGLPEGVDYKIDRADPVMAPFFDELGGLLKEVGAPAEAASKVTGLLARYEATKIKVAHEEANREYEALGATDAARTQRIENVQRALEGRLPEPQAKALKGMAYSKDAVMALEALLSPGGVRGPVPTPQTAEIDPLAARYPKSAK